MVGFKTCKSTPSYFEEERCSQDYLPPRFFDCSKRLNMINLRRRTQIAFNIVSTAYISNKECVGAWQLSLHMLAYFALHAGVFGKMIECECLGCAFQCSSYNNIIQHSTCSQLLVALFSTKRRNHLLFQLSSSKFSHLENIPFLVFFR